MLYLNLVFMVSSSTIVLNVYEKNNPPCKLIVPMENNLGSIINIYYFSYVLSF
jgi:hypothetical protein